MSTYIVVWTADVFDIMQMEFVHLSRLVGDSKYGDAAEHVIKLLHDKHDQVCSPYIPYHACLCHRCDSRDFSLSVIKRKVRGIPNVHDFAFPRLPYIMKYLK